MRDFFPETDHSVIEKVGTAILSPHSDDAALSIGGCLQKPFFPRPITLITVFGRSNYIHGGFHPDWQEATRIRAAEDLAYANALGLKHYYLNLPEVTLRPDSGGVSIFIKSFSMPIRWPESLRNSLQSILCKIQPKVLIIPLGLGCHKDHLLVQRAVSEGMCEKPWHLYYFEDLPYAAEISMLMIQKQAKAINPDLNPVLVDISAVVDAKLRHLSLYLSQIGEKEILAVKHHSYRVGRGSAQERLWIAKT